MALAVVATEIVDLARGVLGPFIFVQTGWTMGHQRPDLGRLTLGEWVIALLGIVPCGMAVVLGIVAMVKNLGRAFGVVAVVLGSLVLVIEVPTMVETLVFLATR